MQITTNQIKKEQFESPHLLDKTSDLFEGRIELEPIVPKEGLMIQDKTLVLEPIIMIPGAPKINGKEGMR